MIEDGIKIGYSKQKAEELHKLSVIPVTTGIYNNIDESNESLSALMKSFDMDTDKIIDELNKLGLN